MLPEGTLAGKTAIITGGGTGLGKAIALEFGELGANIVLASRSSEHLDSALAELHAAGVTRAISVITDVRKPEDVDNMVAAAVAAHGQVDILVNNAAGNFIVPADQLSPNGWRTVIDIVLNGTFYCSRAVGRWMIENKHGGSILNIGATYAWTGGPGTIHSASAKAGTLAMTRTLAVEWARYGIRTNCIAPGPVDTEGAGSKLWAAPEIHDAIEREMPIGRFGRAEEVARACAFVVSEYGALINGECLVMDGGMWLNKGVFALEGIFSPR